MTHDGPVRELRVVLAVEDFDAALAFWRDGLGLAVAGTFGEGDSRGALLSAGRATIEIMAASEARRVQALDGGSDDLPRIWLAAEVVDAPGAADRLEVAGAMRVGQTTETPWRHRIARMQTADGLQLSLFDVIP